LKNSVDKYDTVIDNYQRENHKQNNYNNDINVKIRENITEAEYIKSNNFIELNKSLSKNDNNND